MEIREQGDEKHPIMSGSKACSLREGNTLDNGWCCDINVSINEWSEDVNDNDNNAEGERDD